MISFRLCFILTALIAISVTVEVRLFGRNSIPSVRIIQLMLCSHRLPLHVQSANLRKNRKPSLRGKSQKELDCVMFLTKTKLLDGQEEEEWECEDDQGRFVELDRHYDAEYSDPEAGPLKSGSTILHSDDAFFV
jgi:hypothetical protein